jgi:hypothetical protein
MARKLSFALITLFWLTMNALLWRAEFSDKDAGVATPVALIWQKILTSPDDSGMAVTHGGERVGYLRWAPNIGEETATGKTANENTDIEGRVKKLTGYTLHADGNFLLPEGSGRVRFSFDASFGADDQWKEWNFRSVQRPNLWNVSANREKQTINISLGERGDGFKQTFHFSDFQNPGKLLENLGVADSLPLLTAALPSLGALPGATNSPGVALGLNWEGRQDWLKMGHSRVKVYQLRARLLDKYEILVVISRVGEILRVELPGEMTLVNEALINL